MSEGEKFHALAKLVKNELKKKQKFLQKAGLVVSHERLEGYGLDQKTKDRKDKTHNH